MNLKWDKKYETGNEVVDGQHRQLFQMLEKLNQGVLNGISATELDEVVAWFALYVIQHFRDEENLMKRIKYPELTTHQLLHHDLTLKASDFLDSLSESDNKDVLKVLQFLEAWIKAHILIEDQKLFLWIQQNSLKKS